jgi:potassium channel subfamily K
LCTFTASTIGLGDLAPKTREGRLAAVVFLPMAVAAAGEVLASVGLALIERRQKKIFQSQINLGLSEENIKAMDGNGNGRVEKEEYVIFMLMEMGLVNKSEVEELIDQFDRLDVNSSGYIDHEDLALMAKLRGTEVEKE